MSTVVTRSGHEYSSGRNRKRASVEIEVVTRYFTALRPSLGSRTRAFPRLCKRLWLGHATRAETSFSLHFLTVGPLVGRSENPPRKPSPCLYARDCVTHLSGYPSHVSIAVRKVESRTAHQEGGSRLHRCAARRVVERPSVWIRGFGIRRHPLWRTDL